MVEPNIEECEDKNRTMSVTQLLNIQNDSSLNYRNNARKDSSHINEFLANGEFQNKYYNDKEILYDDDEEVDLSQFKSQKHTREYFRKKLAIAEAVMMTSSSANRRLAARKIEMENNFYQNEFDAENEYIPPKQLLMYLVRMGSFTSAPQIKNVDYQDDTIEVPEGFSTNDLVSYCKMMRGDNLPQLLLRKFLINDEQNKFISNPDISDGLRVLKLEAISKTCSVPTKFPRQIRILQWNLLSQTLGLNNDNFVKCPLDALTWEVRKYQVIEEIVRNDPDIICLQEVDHFKFIQKILATQNYEGVFFPKPDSPCLYINGNNGPDGCAVFYKKDRLEMVNFFTRILEVWRVQSNQVAIAAIFRTLDTNQEVCVTTTHLKARNGALLSKLRNEQGKDLLYFVTNIAEKRPVVVCGDFNAEPIEPIYSTILNYKPLGLSSAYSDLITEESIENNENKANNHDDNDCTDGTKTMAEISAISEPPYTTWKIREEGEVCHTIDYMFYSKDKMTVKNCLMFPSDEEVGPDRTPSFSYPSDHFSLVCDFELNPNE